MLITELESLRKGEALEKDGYLFAFRNREFDLKKINRISTAVKFNSINNVWDIFSDNDREIKNDFKLITKGRESQVVDDTNAVIGKQIFIEKGAKVSCSILNTEAGPIYIGKNCEVMEGSIIRGPFAMSDNGLPIGIQIVANHYNESTLFDVAYYLESFYEDKEVCEKDKRWFMVE